MLAPAFFLVLVLFEFGFPVMMEYLHTMQMMKNNVYTSTPSRVTIEEEELLAASSDQFTVFKTKNKSHVKHCQERIIIKP